MTESGTIDQVKDALASYLAGRKSLAALEAVMATALQTGLKSPAMLAQDVRAAIEAGQIPSSLLRRLGLASPDDATRARPTATINGADRLPKAEGALVIGQLLSGRYRLERKLGEGGMGTVYQASDQQVTGEVFAVKVLNPAIRDSVEALELLREEVRRTRSLAHPNIVGAYSLNVDGEHVYILMECLQGKTLQELLDEDFGRGMRLERAWPIIEDLGAALAYAHDRSVIHGDLKPANIFVTTSGKAKLLDFGIARAARGKRGPQESVARGALTPAWASSEMLEYQPPDTRDDIYALSCILYEMLSGRRPFGDRNAIQARDAGEKPPPIASISARQNAALAQGLSFERSTRTATVEQLLAGLARASASGRLEARRAGHTWILGLCAASGAVALTYVGVAQFRSAAHTTATSVPKTLSQAATVPSNQLPGQAATIPALSIVVLPLANHTGDSQKGYIADAVTSSITSDLTRIRDAYVVPALTAVTYAGMGLTVPQIAAQAHVRFLLTGNVESSGEQLRVNVQLYDGISGQQLWSNVYDGAAANLFALQDRVTTLVGNSMGREMVIAAVRDTQVAAPDAASADLLLNARALMLQPVSAERVKAEEKIYRDLLRRDPDNPTALVGLARVLERALGWGYFQPRTASRENELNDEAEAMAIKARGLGYEGSELDDIIGNVELGRGNFASADHSFQRAAEQAPKDPRNYEMLALVQLAEFQPTKALEYSKRELELAPEPPDGALFNMAVANLQLADYRDAREAIQRSLDINPQQEPAYALSALACSFAGDDAAAAPWAEKARSTHVLPRDLLGNPKGSASYEHWMTTVILPRWRKLGLPE